MFFSVNCLDNCQKKNIACGHISFFYFTFFFTGDAYYNALYMRDKRYKREYLVVQECSCHGKNNKNKKHS